MQILKEINMNIKIKAALITLITAIVIVSFVVIAYYYGNHIKGAVGAVAVIALFLVMLHGLYAEALDSLKRREAERVKKANKSKPPTILEGYNSRRDQK